VSVDEIEARLAAKAAEPSPESIKFEKPGQSVVGRVRRYERGSTDWGDCVICVVESLKTGNLASIWIFGTVLGHAFERLQPKVGEVIRVAYKGEVHREGQSSYKDWSLVVDRDETGGLSYAEAAGIAPATRVVQPDSAPTEFPATGDFHSAAEAADFPAAVDDDIPF